MGIFYRVSNEQSLKERNEIFKEVGIQNLEKNGFERACFKTSWNGEYNSIIKGYSYQLSRIRENNILEIIDVYILKEEPWIQIYLNIFELLPKINSVTLLKDHDGLSFGIPPNSITKMRLRSDDYKGPPLFYIIFLPKHKIGFYYTKSGYEAQLKKLRKLINSDMENINDFVKRWHELYLPNLTNLEGNIIILPAQ